MPPAAPALRGKNYRSLTIRHRSSRSRLLIFTPPRRPLLAESPFPLVPAVLVRRDLSVALRFKDFMLDLRVLMRHAGYTEQQEPHRLYENSAPDLQMYIRRHEFKTIGDLTQLATELETVKQRSLSRANPRWPKHKETTSNTELEAEYSDPQ